MVRAHRSPGERHSAGTTGHPPIGPGKRTLVSELDAERDGGPGKRSLVELIPQAQRKARDDGDEGSQTDARRSEALPASLASEMGNSLGADLSGVRIHTGDGVANEYGAYAVTLNSDIHFAPGKYDPSSTQGKTLIAHEVAHTVQQGASPTTQKAEGAGGTGALEQEADTAAATPTPSSARPPRLMATPRIRQPPRSARRSPWCARGPSPDSPTPAPGPAHR